MLWILASFFVLQHCWKLAKVRSNFRFDPNVTFLRRARHGLLKRESRALISTIGWIISLAPLICYGSWLHFDHFIFIFILVYYTVWNWHPFLLIDRRLCRQVSALSVLWLTLFSFSNFNFLVRLFIICFAWRTVSFNCVGFGLFCSSRR